MFILKRLDRKTKDRMTTNRIRQIATLYDEMQVANTKDISNISLAAMSSIFNNEVHNQVLGIAALLVVLMQRYELSHIEVLSMAESLVNSGEYGNIHPDFKVLEKYCR